MFSLFIKRFFSGTFLSRISGMGRDLAMVFIFGDHPSVAAFMVAFRLSNLFRRLFGEGPFQSAFIPHFEGIKSQDEKKSTIFFRKIMLLMAVLLLIITVITEIGASIIYPHLSANNREIVSLIEWMMPGIIFICLYGLNISLLNCNDSFFVPSFAPFICNAVWILGAIFLKDMTPTSAMTILAKLIVLGFFLQWLFTLPLTLKFTTSNLKEWFNFKIPTEIRSLVKSFSLGTIGAGAIQINVLVDAFFARYADLKGPVYLWYSIRLEQLAFAILGIACVSTVVPRLSRAIKNRDLTNASLYFSFSYKRIFTLMIPCTFAILAIGGASVNLLYGRGQFSGAAVAETTLCLWAYTLGLVPTTMVVLFSSLFYANGNFKTPAIASIITVLINIFLSGCFVLGLNLGTVSIALATSASSWFNFFVLQKIAKKDGWETNYFISQGVELILASSMALFGAFLIEYLTFDFTSLLLLNGSIFLPKNFTFQIGHFLLLSSTFVVGLWLHAKIFKNRDLLEIFQEFTPSIKYFNR